MPVTSGYIRINVTDPAKSKESLDNVIRLGKVIKKYGGYLRPFRSTASTRQGYDFKAVPRRASSPASTIPPSALNDLGIGAGLHQHTGTAVETRDEVYYVMEKCNTRVMKFAPDAGQLQKAEPMPPKSSRTFSPSPNTCT